MSLFMCEKCGCVENTATSNYWTDKYSKPPKPLLCSECDPELKVWHGLFEKRAVSGMQIGEDGFLYSADCQPSHTKIVATIP
jgi:hypothetical protein